jgi:hypothetical protein
MRSNLPRDEARVLEVDQKWLLVNQFLGNLSGEGKHSKTSLLKLTHLVVDELSLRLWPPSESLNLGIGTSAWLGLKKTKSLKGRDDTKGKRKPDGVGVDGLKSTSGGGKEIISESSIVSTLLRNDKSKNGHLGETSVHDLNLTVTGKLLGAGLGCETSRVEEPNWGECSDEALGGSGGGLLYWSCLLDGTGGRQSRSGRSHGLRSEGGGAGDKSTDDSKLHGGVLEDYRCWLWKKIGRGGL